MTGSSLGDKVVVARGIAEVSMSADIHLSALSWSRHESMLLSIPASSPEVALYYGSYEPEPPTLSSRHLSVLLPHLTYAIPGA